MGSQRRLLAQLEEIGITDETEAYALSDAIETLTGAGDDFTNALWSWQDGQGQTREQTVVLARAVAEKILSAIDVIEGEQAQNGRHTI